MISLDNCFSWYVWRLALFTDMTKLVKIDSSIVRIKIGQLFERKEARTTLDRKRCAAKGAGPCFQDEKTK